MENSEVSVEIISDRMPHEHSTEMMTTKSQYGIPENYNPSDHPPVKLRNQTSSADQSETQRKRRSKNRLSNRRSTGFVSSDTIEEASKMGPDGTANGTGKE